MVFERLRSGYAAVAQGERGEKRGGGVVEVVREKVVSMSWKVKGFAIGGIVALVLLMMEMSSGGSIHTTPEEIVPGAQYLHILIPANDPDVNLCKMLVSAGTLDYPVPSIITWNTTYDNSRAADNGAHIARVSGVIDYLKMIRDLGQDRNKDVVLIVDGYDTWFQLRPDVLMERFFEVNRNANNRIVRFMGQAAMDAGGISQRIVFGAQKECSKEADDPACYAVPGSPLGRSVYGSKTDRGNDREKYLSAGFMMGELENVKKLYEKTLGLMNADKEKGTEQEIFSRIFGEQEFQRAVIRQRYQGWFSRVKQFFGLEKQGVLGPHPTHRKIENPGADSEYGIGLDYEGLLGASTAAGKDLDWIVHNDTKSIMKAKATNKITSHQKLDMPADILRSLQPFWARNPEPKTPQELSWKDLSLYTNLWTGVIPATLRHDSPRTDENSLRKTHWDRMWTQPYARTLLDAHVNEPYKAFAILKGKDIETAWWPMHQQKWRIRNHIHDKKKEWIRWEHICGGLEDEIYRDVKGPWKPPRVEY